MKYTKRRLNDVHVQGQSRRRRISSASVAPAPPGSAALIPGGASSRLGRCYSTRRLCTGAMALFISSLCPCWNTSFIIL
jgi:hypothetical protein